MENAPALYHPWQKIFRQSSQCLDMDLYHIKFFCEISICKASRFIEASVKANINNTLLFKLFVMQPEVVAAIGYNNLQRGKRVVTAGLYNKLHGI